MYPELEVIQTLMDRPVYDEDGKPWTAPVLRIDVLWALHDKRSVRSRIILALLSTGF